MSFKILSKQRLAQQVMSITLLAPEVARNASPGQFVVIIPEEKGERIPLTIAGSDKIQGGVTIIFQEVGFSTKRLAGLNIDESVFAVLGPLGRPTHIEKFGTVVCVGGGVGIAEMLPVVKAYKEGGNRVVGIVGSRTRGLLILLDELKGICDELHVTTDDGSFGTKGFVTDVLKDELSKERCALVYAVGPVLMMKKVAEMTRPAEIKTIVSLNPVMVDATGMCGVCRCRVAGKTVFGCVDGPEFDAHLVDFDELQNRLNFLKEEEARILK